MSTDVSFTRQRRCVDFAEWRVRICWCSSEIISFLLVIRIQILVQTGKKLLHGKMQGVVAIAFVRTFLALLLCAVINYVSAGDSVINSTSSSFQCPEYIFAFGDSATDTGNAQAEVPIVFDLNYPYGKTYEFPHPNERNRYCDGRMVIDFTTQAFGFPFLEPYSRHLQESAYRRGVNFAYSAACAAVSNAETPFFLQRETQNYFAFIDNHTVANIAGNGLYIFPEIGGNDFMYAYLTLGASPAEVITNDVPAAISAIRTNMEELIAVGAKSFVVFNIPPQGCSTLIMTLYESNNFKKDELGCLVEYNNVNKVFNDQLNATIAELQQTYPTTTFLQFDYYAAYLEIFRNTEQYGFVRENAFNACCGYGGNYNYNLLVLCGNSGAVVDPVTFKMAIINISESCPNPNEYIVWDGVHGTEAFYRIITTFFLTGRFVNGPPGFSNLVDTCGLDTSNFWQPA